MVPPACPLNHLRTSHAGFYVLCWHLTGARQTQPCCAKLPLAKKKKMTRSRPFDYCPGRLVQSIRWCRGEGMPTHGSARLNKSRTREGRAKKSSYHAQPPQCRICNDRRNSLSVEMGKKGVSRQTEGPGCHVGSQQLRSGSEHAAFAGPRAERGSA